MNQLACEGGVCAKDSAVILGKPGTQKWSYDPARKALKSGEMCLDVKGASTARGAKIQTYRCHGGGNQRWIPEDFQGPKKGSTQFRNEASGKCLDISGGSDVLGRPAQLWDCKGHYNGWDVAS